MSAGWFKIYPPGAFRGRPGWHIRGKDMYGRAIDGKLPATIKTATAAGRLGAKLLKRSNSDPPPAVEPEPDAPVDHSFKAAARAYRVVRQPRAVEWQRIEKLIACNEIGPVDVALLTTSQVATFATETMPKVKPDTRNRELVTPYSIVLHFAHEEGWRDEPTIRRFKEDEDEIRAVKPAEVDRLVAHADRSGTYKPSTYIDRRDLAPYKVAALEYLRLPETRVADLMHMRPADLDAPAGRIKVKAGDRFEREEWRSASARVAEMMAALPPCRHGWLFPWRAKSGYHNWLRPLAEAVGLTAKPRLWHHASEDAELDRALQAMIVRAAAEKPGVTVEISQRQADRNARYKVAFLEFLRLRGTRISDVLQLERARDLDLPNAKVRLVIGKARDKVQWLPLNATLVALLANLKPCDGVYVFPWRTRSGVYYWLRPLAKDLGIKASPHMFRHALGEEAIEAEVDLLTLTTMGAWSSLNSARRYARASEKRLRAADDARALAAGSSVVVVGKMVGKPPTR